MMTLVGRHYRKIGALNLFIFISFASEHGVNKLLIMPFLARQLGEVKFGSFVLAMSVVLFLVAIIPAGIFMTNYRENAQLDKKERAELFDTILTLLMIACLFFAAVIFISKNFITRVFNNDQVARFIPFLLGYLICIVAFNFGKQLLAIDLKFHLRMVFDIIYGMLICLMIPAYFLFGDVAVSISYFFASTMIVIALLTYLKQKEYITKLRLAPQKLRLILSSAPSFTIAAGALTVMTLADRWIVGVFRPMAEVTYYYVGIQIASLFVLPFTLLNSVLNPLISKRKDFSDFTHQELRLFTFSVISSVTLVASLGVFLGPVIIRILYGEQILASSRVAFYILLVGQAFYLFRIYAQPIATKFFSPILSSNLQLISLAIFVVLHLILVPSYGILGAAVATAVSFSVLGLLHLKYVLLRARDQTLQRSKVELSSQFTLTES